MNEMSVETLFASKSYEAKTLICPTGMSSKDRKRLLTHVIAEMTQKILAMPNANPVGLAVTVTLIPALQPDTSPELCVVATCPQYEMVDEFFN